MTTKEQNKKMLDAIEGKIKHKCKLCGKEIDCLTSTATSTTDVTMTSKGKIKMDEESLPECSKTTNEENERMLKSLEGEKTFKHCLGCGRMFTKGTVCPWCGTGWVYGYIDEHNRLTFEDERAKNGFIETGEGMEEMK